MLYYVAAPGYTNVFRWFMDQWAPGLRGQVALLDYGELRRLRRLRRLPPGVYIFADFERLLDEELAVAGDIAAWMAERPEAYRLLNDPRKYRRRLDFLRELYRRGINHFNAHAWDADPETMRYPVFLKADFSHQGPMSALLEAPADVRRFQREMAWVERQLAGGRLRQRMVWIEFCRVPEQQGGYKKYSFMKLGEQWFPRHVLLGGGWVTKYADLVREEVCQEEDVFLREGRPSPEIIAAFEVAGLEYGRIDYAVHEGGVEIWEINTHPTVIPAPGDVHPRRLPSQQYSASQIGAGFRALAAGAPSGAEGTAPMPPVGRREQLARWWHGWEGEALLRLGGGLYYWPKESARLSKRIKSRLVKTLRRALANSARCANSL